MIIMPIAKVVRIVRKVLITPTMKIIPIISQLITATILIITLTKLKLRKEFPKPVLISQNLRVQT